MYGRIGSRNIAYKNCNKITEEADGKGALWLGDFTAALDKVSYIYF